MAAGVAVLVAALLAVFGLAALGCALLASGPWWRRAAKGLAAALGLLVLPLLLVALPPLLLR
jgi:hypothetical protein